jgi:hypothetical protein
MIFGICIASVPLLSRATSYRRAKLNSLAGTVFSPLLYFGRMITGRTATDQKSKTSAVYDVERESESNNRLVELQKLNGRVPVQSEAVF